jgi:putative GTP pyrophosphokinase
MAQNHDALIDECLRRYADERSHIGNFTDSVRKFFADHSQLSGSTPPFIHSLKMRLKDPDHLRDKLLRKLADGDSVEATSLFSVVTDLGGVRVLHLHRVQFQTIDAAIRSQLDRGDWVLDEAPVAYTWDPDSAAYFKSLGIATELKDSHYTSVHYVVRPRRVTPLHCEIQVRTLFEEIWGETDHALNYPEGSPSRACVEQIRVLAKLIGAGSRLVDSIFSSHATDNSAIPPVLAPSAASAPQRSTASEETMRLRLRIKGGGQSSSQWVTLPFQITNDGPFAVPLSDVTVRYWFTADVANTFGIQCNYTQIPGGCGSLAMSIDQVKPPRKRASHCFEVRFLPMAGALAPKTSAEVQVQFHENSWRDFRLPSHYSHRERDGGFADWNRVTLHVRGTCVWGDEPE